MLKSRWLLQVTSGSLSRGENRVLTHTGKNMSIQAQTMCPCSGCMVERCRKFHTHKPPLMLSQWHGFLVRVCSLAFVSVKNLYHKAVVYNSAWQGLQTPWGTKEASSRTNKDGKVKHTVYTVTEKQTSGLEERQRSQLNVIEQIVRRKWTRTGHVSRIRDKLDKPARRWKKRTRRLLEGHHLAEDSTR